MPHTDRSKKQVRRQGEAMKTPRAFVSRAMKKTDPLGSYTGVPTDRNEKPTQDVDDL